MENKNLKSFHYQTGNLNLLSRKQINISTCITISFSLLKGKTFKNTLELLYSKFWIFFFNLSNENTYSQHM